MSHSGHALLITSESQSVWPTHTLGSGGSNSYISLKESSDDQAQINVLQNQKAVENRHSHEVDAEFVVDPEPNPEKVILIEARSSDDGTTSVERSDRDSESETLESKDYVMNQAASEGGTRSKEESSLTSTSSASENLAPEPQHRLLRG